MYKFMRLAFGLAVGVAVFLVSSDQSPSQAVRGITVESRVAIEPEEPPPADQTPLCPFPRTARRLRNKEALRVVAIGSSSTVGAGASGASKTYPAQLNAFLVWVFPDVEIRVYNKGANGETAAQTLARFKSDVFALKADMVVWQVGTNDALRNISFADFEQVVESGVSQLRMQQVDVALLDLQYVGGGNASRLATYQAGIEHLADRLQVTRIPRWNLMKDLIQSGQYTLKDLVTRDGLHTTDIPYQQTADHTARLIVKCLNPRFGHGD